MTAYRTSYIGYQSVNVSSSRCVFFCTCIIYYSASLSIVCVIRSQPPMPTISCTQWPRRPSHKNSLLALVASPLQDQLRGTRCRHHSAMTNCLSLHFAVYSRLNFGKCWPIFTILSLSDSSKRVMKVSLNVPAHLKHVATLPCEMQMSGNTDNLKQMSRLTIHFNLIYYSLESFA